MPGMAVGALVCGQPLVSLRPLAGRLASGQAARKPIWNPLAVPTVGGSRSQFFGSSLSFALLSSCDQVLRRCHQRTASLRASSDGKRTKFLVAKRERTAGTPTAESGQGDGIWPKLSKAVLRAITEFVKLVPKPAMVALLLSLLLTHNPEMAIAAGGGRVGGRVGGGGSFSSSKSYSAPSSGYSMPRSYSAPSPGFSYSVPYATPSPFFGGGLGGGLYVGPAYGVGLGGGSSVFFLIILGFIVLQAVSGFVSERYEDGSVLSSTRKCSVMKLQVGLLGMARTLQRDLEQIAEQADTTTAEGLHYVLTETCLALMRHPDFCISGVSSSDMKRSINNGEERFNQLSLEERGKFDEETLINVNNLRKRMMTAPKANRFNNEYIVVTILVAAEGGYELPLINSNADLKEGLKKLASIPVDSMQAVEVLWTPQHENDTLSERELLRDYPLLRSL